MMVPANHQENRHAVGGDGLDVMVAFDDVQNTTGLDAMEEDGGAMWLGRQGDLLDHENEADIFYLDFPPLPDFPCMSSSSSSSSTRAPVKPISSTSSSSSSSAASSAVLKSDADKDVEKKNQRYYHFHDQMEVPPAALSSTASMEALPPPTEEDMGDVDCMDVMQSFGCMDLIDPGYIWDPSSINFQSENFEEYHQDQTLQEDSKQGILQQCNHDLQENDNGGQGQRPLDELGAMFFEWLKSNKEYISAEDVRSIKLKRATIESASNRLGSSKEGKMQLLKLILEWVEQYQLQKKRQREEASPFPSQCQEPYQNQNPNPNTSIFTPSPWMPPPPTPYAADPAAIIAAPVAFQSMAGYVSDPYAGSTPVPLNQTINGHPVYHTEFHQVVDSPSWPYGMALQYSPFPQNNCSAPPAMPHPHAFAGYGNQYPYSYYQGINGEKLERMGSSATKEARKKRMARQKRLLPHHRPHNHHNHQNRLHNPNAIGLRSENCTAAAANWEHWRPATTALASNSALPMMPASADAHQPRTTEDRQPKHGQKNQLRQQLADQRQGWKSEKNLKFLLQKVLKQSDVGSLGRIVLPKKEAETHLPELDARDGIPIAIEDIGTSRVWNMRYRFWPNNKSRMYLLENTGDFVRANRLQEGDFIVIYSDVKSGKYLIRGVRVRQQGSKCEAKKAEKSPKSLRTALPAAGNSLSFSPQPSAED
ncbi:B3 domain-containing transcription factor ABI3 [Diospyros lotus]|uniref:B3 domain-containing transcription factor ABI3 n=1 Tax=Diospyros lotus TaxID=55363 RepID=UPI00225497E8|nr:B3 domain-containing transcription factor ABI3 [Diospyros lotus]